VAIFGICLDQCLFALFCRFPDVLPIRLVWLSPLLDIIGGGQPTVAAAILGILSDIGPPSMRSNLFLATHVSGMVGFLTAPSVVGLIIDGAGLWPAMIFALALMGVAAAATVVAVPETLRRQEVRDEPPSGLLSRKASVRQHFRQMLQLSGELSAFFERPPLVLLLCTSLVVDVMNYGFAQFLVQMASKRYDIPISKTGYILSTYGFAHLVTAVVLLPAAGTWILAKYQYKASEEILDSASHVSPSLVDLNAVLAGHRDLLLARISHFILVLGALYLAFAPTLPNLIVGLTIAALGAGFNTYTRSLMALFVEESRRSRLYSLVSIMEVIGSLYAPPLISGLFALGMRYDGGEKGPWLGLPYLGIAGCAAVAVGVLAFVRIPSLT
jgi:MFS family permease